MITRSLTRPLTRAITRSLTSPGVGGGVAVWTPANLFGASEPGFAYDFSDATKLYTDSARTTLVTTAGDLIGSVTDISGRGNNASQGTAASKFSWQTTYANADGVDDFLTAPAIDFTGADKVTVVAGVRINTTATSLIVELSESVASNAGGFALLGFNGGTNLSSPLVAASVSALGSTRYTASATGVNNVLAATVDLSQATTLAAFSMRRNGADAGGETIVDAGPPGVGNFGNHPLYIGSRGGVTFPFNGRIYRMIVIGRALTADEMLAADEWCGAPFT